ncbi:MAG: hypothetical protein ACE37F_20605 [Nannocystaceae bacterium]|nr:hypothetical protein [bacterium]
MPASQPTTTGSSATASGTDSAEEGSTSAPLGSTGSGEGSTGDSEPSTGEADSASSTSGTGAPDGDTSSTGGRSVVCGDGRVGRDEACDDGNRSNLDGCSVDCVELFDSGSQSPCETNDVAMCAAFGAECRRHASEGYGICYWVDSAEAATCDQTLGRWESPEGAYAADNPRVTIPDPGVCINETPQLRCTPEEEQACTQADGDLCFRPLDEAGLEPTGASLCFWDVDEGGCEATPGIWTSAGDGFAMDHPNALPEGLPACITQVQNL